MDWRPINTGESLLSDFFCITTWYVLPSVLLISEVNSEVHLKELFIGLESVPNTYFLSLQNHSYHCSFSGFISNSLQIPERPFRMVYDKGISKGSM